MAVKAALKLTAPQGTSGYETASANVHISRNMRVPAQLTATFTADWAAYNAAVYGEDNSSPFQRNAYLTYREDGEYLFRGKVISINLEVSGGFPVVTLVALDKAHTLSHTLALYEPATPRSIANVNTGTKTFRVDGVDCTAEYTAGTEIFVSFSTANNGEYTVASSSFGGGNTSIVVNEAIPSSTADGKIQPEPQVIWHRYTPSLAVGNVTLYPGTYYAGDFRNVYYPAISSTAAWLSTAASISTTLGEIMASSGDVDTLKLSTSYSGGPPAGFITITTGGNTECLQYNGHSYNQSDGYWYLHQVKRAKLGSSAVAHSSGDTVYFRTGKRIHFDTPVTMEGNNGTSWEIIEEKDHFEVNAADGSFNFNQDPLSLRNTGSYSAIRASYAVYDEESTGASALMLAAVVEGIATANPARGGPGIRAGFYTDSCTLDTSALPDIVVTTVKLTEPYNAFDALTKLLAELELNKGTQYDLVNFIYRSDLDTLYFNGVAQASGGSAAARYYADESRRYEEASIEQVKSYVLSKYEQGERTNLASCLRMWNTAASPYDDGAGTEPWAWVCNSGRWFEPDVVYPGGYNITKSISTGEPNQRNRLTDNDAASGIRLTWSSAPSAGHRFWAWLPGTSNTAPNKYLVDKIILTFQLIGTSDSTTPFGIKVYYYDTLTGSTSSSTPSGSGGGVIRSLSQKWKPGELNYQSYTLETPDNFLVPMRGISVYFDSYLTQGDLGSTMYGFALLDVAIFGSTYRGAFMHVAESFSQNQGSAIVGPDTAAKLLDSTMGQHRVEILDVGPATREVAKNLANLQLLQTLAQAQARVYEINSERGLQMGGIAYPGETLEFSDGFRGVCDTVEYDITDGVRGMTVRAVNYNATLFGGGI